MSGFMLDTGALIAIDRGDRRMLALLEAARAERLLLSVTTPAIAQAWRNGRRQARLAAFLKHPGIEVAPFHTTDARAVGELAGLCGHADVVDVHIALLARQRGQAIVTSDVDDIRQVDPRAQVIAI